MRGLGTDHLTLAGQWEAWKKFATQGDRRTCRLSKRIILRVRFVENESFRVCTKGNTPNRTLFKTQIGHYLWGLASYSVHMTPLGLDYGKPLNKPETPLMQKCLPWTHRERILQKIKSELSHITHHTSHITYCMCRPGKIQLFFTRTRFKP